MKKLIKITIVSLLLTLFSTTSFARVVGNLTLGVPTVTITNSQMQAQLNALSDYGFTNIQLLEMHISYDPITPGGFFIYSFSYNPPLSSTVYTTTQRVELSYDSGDNEFEPIINGGGAMHTECTKANCNACDPNGINSCSPCAPITEGIFTTCEPSLHLDWYEAALFGVLMGLLTWLITCC